MSDGKVKTFINLAVGWVVFTLFDGLQGIWNGEAIEFDADHDTVAERAVLSGREDLLPLLKHRRIVEVPVEIEGQIVQALQLKEVVYTPQGKPVFLDPNDEMPIDPPFGNSAGPNPFNALKLSQWLGSPNASPIENLSVSSMSDSLDGIEATDAVELAEKTPAIAAAQENAKTETIQEPETKEPEKSDKAKSKK